MNSPFCSNDSLSPSEGEDSCCEPTVNTKGSEFYRVSTLPFPVIYSPPKLPILEGRQPYVVAFHCSCCRLPYYCVMQENPWYGVYHQTCPHCQKSQIPTLDINLPINARELDPNVEYFYNQVKDEEFLDLTDVDESADFSLEMTEPVFRLVFADHIKDEMGESASPAFKKLQEAVNLHLLALVTHAVSCNTFQHSSAKHTNLCRNTKILLLHMASCQKLDCLFPLCPPCRPVLSYLSCFPAEATVKKEKMKRSPMMRRAPKIVPEKNTVLNINS